MGNQQRTARIVRRAALIAFAAAIPIFLVTSNIRFLAGDIAFYERGFRKHDADQASNVSMAELDRAAGEIIAYFEDDATTLRIVVNTNAGEEPLFSQDEIDHMRDVKRIMRALFRVNEIALAVILAYIGCAVLWSGEQGLRTLAKGALGGLLGGIVAIVAVGAVAAAGFSAFWERFHKILFRNDLWQLDPDTDRLIQIFPEKFWQEATFIVAGLTLLEAAAVVVLAAGYLFFARGADRGTAIPTPAQGERRAAS